MYDSDTILVMKPELLKEKQKGRRDPFPYARVRVIGPSPQTHASADYTGRNAAGVVIQPLEGFDSTIDEPFGKLKELYDVESTPVHEIPADAFRVITPGTAGPTPEETFADVAADLGEKKVEKPKPEKKLPDPPKKSNSPL